MNERELQTRAKNGDFEAFNELVKMHSDRIYRLALKSTKNRDDAEDIVQNTFLKAVDKIDQFKGDSAFGTWIYSIALNEIRGHIAQSNKMTIRTLEEYLPGGHGKEAGELFDWSDPHKYMESRQIQSFIDETLRNMPDQYSMPFILKYIEELPVKEIAEILNLSIPAAKSRILRARLALRQELSDYLEENKSGKMR